MGQDETTLRGNARAVILCICSLFLLATTPATGAPKQWTIRGRLLSRQGAPQVERIYIMPTEGTVDVDKKGKLKAPQVRADKSGKFVLRCPASFCKEGKEYAFMVGMMETIRKGTGERLVVTLTGDAASVDLGDVFFGE
jgi:hypothetical protein